ncbi:ABC transporter permease, partial [Calditrichota bacterium]
MNVCPEVELATRVRNYRDGTVVSTGDKKFNETRHGMADENFFKVFSFHLITGNPETVLSKPYTVIISESAVKKYFGDSDPIGKTLTIYDNDFMIEGVYQDIPPNSHFHLDILTSLKSFPRYLEPAWGLNVFKTYALLKEGTDPQVLQDNLKNIVKNYMFDSVENYENQLA